MALEREDADLRVQRNRFDTVCSWLHHRKRRFLEEVGSALEPARGQTAPKPTHFWQWVEETALRQWRRAPLRLGAVTMATIPVLSVVQLGYPRFLAPPPSVWQALEDMDAGQQLMSEGTLGALLEDFEDAAEFMPENPSQGPGRVFSIAG